MKNNKKIAGLVLIASVFVFSACSLNNGNTSNDLNNPVSVSDPVKDIESAEADKSNTSVSDNEGTDQKKAAASASENNNAAEEHKTKDSWIRIYIQEGKENVTSYNPTISVEYNQKNDYVTYTMDYMGTNVYMTVDSVNLVPIDGEYFITDYNENPSDPAFTQVYMTYTESQITIVYWDEEEKVYDYDSPVVFNFKEEY